MFKFLSLITLIYHVVAWEFFEGDIRLLRSQAENHYSREFVLEHARVWDGHSRTLAGLDTSMSDELLWRAYRGADDSHWEIPYTFPTHNEEDLENTLSFADKQTIISCMNEMEELTFKSFKFVEKNDTHDYFLNIGRFTDGCWSYIGRVIPGGQTVNYASTCMVRGTVMHELVHALGFYHEQSRKDRDSYVSILTENIQDDKISNFEIRDDSFSNGVEYDYGSVMHYNAYAFSKNKQKTIYAPKPIGQRVTLSNSDAVQLTLLYRCKTYWNYSLTEHCTQECPCPEKIRIPCNNSTQCVDGVECFDGYCGGTVAPTTAPTTDSSESSGVISFFETLWDEYQIEIIVGGGVLALLLIVCIYRMLFKKK